MSRLGRGPLVVAGGSVGYRGSARVEALELDDGAVLPVDLVVVGIGSAPATGWLDDSGLDVADGVRCGPGLAAEGVDGVWAVGDVARWADVRSGNHVGATALNAPHDLLAVRRALTAGRTTPQKGHVA